MSKMLGIVIISQYGGNVEKLNVTIDSLKAAFSSGFQCSIAFQYQCSDDMQQYCTVNNISYYEYINQKELYAKAVELMDSSYISFIKEGDSYYLERKNNIASSFDKNKYEKLFILPISYDNGQYILNRNLKKLQTVNIDKTPQRIWFALESCFISKELFKNVLLELLDDNLEYEFEEILIIRIIVANGGYTVLRNSSLYVSEMLEDSPVAKSKYYDEEWYYSSCDNAQNLLSYSKEKFGRNVEFLQYAAVYLLKNCINANVNVKNKHILTGEKLKQFYSLINQILREIDDTVIINTMGNKLVNYYLLKVKYNTLDEPIVYQEYESKLSVIHKDKFLFNAADTKIKIFLMDFKNGELIITGSYPFPFDEEKLSIYAEYDNRNFYAEKNYMYSQYKAFGKPIYENYVFDIKIPLKNKTGRNYMMFYLEGQKAHVKLDLNFNKPLARLSGAHFAYWDCADFTINYRRQGLLVMNRSFSRTVKREILFIGSLIRSANKFAREAGWLRVLYRITKPFFTKQIWLFEDKIYKGGDNGEYLYSYAIKQKDGIKKYYILKQGCLDAERFHLQHKTYVNFGTLKHRLLFLNSTIVFETHNNVTKQHGFDEKHEKYFRDLINSKHICIQHGLTVQKMPDLTNRINDNLKLYFLASGVEKQNLMEKPYDYFMHQDILKITGCPRYDGLKNNDQRQILITPTWRSYLALPSFQYGESRRHNKEFKNFDYFKIYNSLINNERLIKYAQKCHYRIIYLLHPCTSSQINDYDQNEYVQLIAATDDLNYEKILTESSLMVTDYSGVQFDFAYMYKPIVYFHPDELPPSYEEGAYKYETMALGEIVKTVESLVEKLCDYMENNCEIKPEYRKRVDGFFKYHDHSNCERIYREVMNSMVKRK